MPDPGGVFDRTKNSVRVGAPLVGPAVTASRILQLYRVGGSSKKAYTPSRWNTAAVGGFQN